MGKKSDLSKKNVVSLSEVRARRSSEERRKVERHFLREMLQFFCVLEDQVLPLELLEASETGCSFRIPHETKAAPIEEGQRLSLRIYLSRETYLLLGIQVLSVVPLADRGRKFTRYGCSFDTSFASYPAFRQLMGFIASYAELCRREKEKYSVG